MDAAMCVLGDAQAKVNRIRGAWRDEVRVNTGAGGPCVALIDRIAMSINGEGLIKLRAGIDRTRAMVLDHATPEEDLAVIVAGFELKPAVECVHCAAGKEMADRECANHHVDAGGFAGNDGS